MKRTMLCLLGLFLLGALVGCGDGKAVVNGTVTLDGEKVPDGAVAFVKSDGGSVREGAVIKDGQFQCRMPPGTYKVELTGKKVLRVEKRKGFDGKDEEVEITDERFPEWYNTKTELTEEIKSGTNTVELKLKSKK